jgi:hypothetical protein
MFPIAPGFYPMWFAQSSTPIYINYKGEIQGCTFVFILQLGVKRGASIGGMPNVSKKVLVGQSIWLLSKRKRKSCEHTHDLINMNHTLSAIVSPNKGSKILVHLHMFFHRRVSMYCKVM